MPQQILSTAGLLLLLPMFLFLLLSLSATIANAAIIGNNQQSSVPLNFNQYQQKYGGNTNHIISQQQNQLQFYPQYSATFNTDNQQQQPQTRYAQELNREQKYNFTQSAKSTDTHVRDRFNHRYPDGSYEYRFELMDGTARYERGYFVDINYVKTLIVVGYYAYWLPDGRYLTVFYNADQYGYRQNQSITSDIYPNLPRSIDVQHHRQINDKVQVITSKTATTTTTARPYSQLQTTAKDAFK